MYWIFCFLFHVLGWIYVNFLYCVEKKTECIVCQDAKGKEKLVATPSEESFQKLLECARERQNYRDGRVVGLVERTKDTLPSVLATNSSYHKNCYAAITNISKLERARKRYWDSIDSGEASLIKRKAGRPRLQVPEQQEERLMTQSREK